jgi:hypothetical protein
MRIFQVAGVLALALGGMAALTRYGKSPEPTVECPCVGCCRSVPPVKTPTAYAPLLRPASTSSLSSGTGSGPKGVSFDRAPDKYSRVTDDTVFFFMSPPPPRDEVHLGPVRVLWNKPYIVRLMEAFNWSPPRARS